MKRPELLAPAGNMEKLKLALHYGADSVFLSGGEFSLRVASDNFSIEDLSAAVELAHRQDRKIYVAINASADNNDIAKLSPFLHEIRKCNADAFIISDPGVIETVREVIPEIPVHLSTQANVTNWKSAMFWKKQGISRICVARELSLREISEIKNRVDIEIEAFIHGAMCISFSGRCLLSSYMTGRSSNRGDCAHPCRYSYALIEETRPGEFYPIEEDERGTYIMSSKDLCMVEHIREMVDAGIDCFKIEGRTKGISYIGSVVKVYREAINRYAEGTDTAESIKNLKEELNAVSNRGYTTGFYLNNPGREGQNYRTSLSIKSGKKEFAGIVRRIENNNIYIEVRNRFGKGDKVEIEGTGGKSIRISADIMETLSGEHVLTAIPGMTIIINHDPVGTICVNDLVRKLT